MTSTLSRLFHYAKATGASAIENFTTEALAGAIRTDPAPLIRALSTVGLDITSDAVEVNSQVTTDAGIIDLLLTVGGAKPVVIDVKVDAGQSGDQL